MNAKVLEEIMRKYDKYRGLWINLYKTDEGFDEWFTSQIDKPAEESL